MKKILVCDDDASTRRVISFIFSTLGYDVMETDNGASAIRLIRDNEFSVALMDVDMPELNGIEAIREIRTFKQNLTIIMITGHKLSEIMEVSYRQLDVYDIIEKPFDVEYLKNIVQEAIILQD